MYRVYRDYAIGIMSIGRPALSILFVPTTMRRNCEYWHDSTALAAEHILVEHVFVF
jgi:hypothetical protein